MAAPVKSPSPAKIMDDSPPTPPPTPVEEPPKSESSEESKQSEIKEKSPVFREDDVSEE